MENISFITVFKTLLPNNLTKLDMYESICDELRWNNYPQNEIYNDEELSIIALLDNYYGNYPQIEFDPCVD